MNPSDGFWEGMGAAFARSPWWAIVGGLLVIGALFIVARYIVPSHERVRLERELDIEQQRAETDADRVRANALLAEQQRQTNTFIDGMRQSLEASTAHTDVLVAELRGSRDRSRAMGEDMTHVRDDAAHVRATTDRTAEQVEDIHRHIFKEGTD